ncbi:hypothetical protein [Vibrio owensii]|uniref:hypothetical protein n=1 Tax=Vibrio harveyi group TaxID=717610 RepID=UPI003CC56C4F
MRKTLEKQVKLDNLLAASELSEIEAEIDPDQEWLSMLNKIESNVNKELDDIDLDVNF